MKLLPILFVIAIVILFIDLSIKNVEQRECKQWQTEDRAFAQWQIAQCDYHQIELNN